MHSKIGKTSLPKKLLANHPGGCFSRHVFSIGNVIAPYKWADRLIFCLLAFLIAILFTGCSPAPAAAPTKMQPSVTPDPTHTPMVIETETAVVITIENDEPASGIAGMPPPDWLAWGAQAFTVAPDGSFWILDTPAAHPPRLLQFSPGGALQAQISLEGQVTGAVDVAAAGERVWVLGIGSQPAQVTSFGPSGALLETHLIPEGLFENQGDFAANFLDDLLVGEGGELLLRGPGSPALYEFLDAKGEISAALLEAYTFGGHRYRVEQPDRIVVDDEPIEIAPATPGGRVLAVDLLGVTRGGSFYAAAIEELVRDGQPIGSARVVHAFALNGIPPGVSLPPQGAVWVETDRDLALGPDGALYTLVSQADHSVDIVRLGFGTELAEIPEPPGTPTPLAEGLVPLRPAWTTPPTGASDLEIARNALLAFFTDLHDGQYSQAAAYYGGPPEAVAMPNPDSPPTDPGQFWQEACALSQCLQVAGIVGEEQAAPDEFHFLIEFMWDNGTLFVLGPCCGASEADMPPVWQFPYTVRVIEGQFVVMEPPQYVP